jgi:hypothetical protein
MEKVKYLRVNSLIAGSKLLKAAQGLAQGPSADKVFSFWAAGRVRSVGWAAPGASDPQNLENPPAQILHSLPIQNFQLKSLFRPDGSRPSFRPSWLLLAALGCSRLLLATSDCSWLLKGFAQGLRSRPLKDFAQGPLKDSFLVLSIEYSIYIYILETPRARSRALSFFCETLARAIEASAYQFQGWLLGGFAPSD